MQCAYAEHTRFHSSSSPSPPAPFCADRSVAARPAKAEWRWCVGVPSTHQVQSFRGIEPTDTRSETVVTTRCENSSKVIDSSPSESKLAFKQTKKHVINSVRSAHVSKKEGRIPQARLHVESELSPPTVEPPMFSRSIDLAGESSATHCTAPHCTGERNPPSSAF